MKIGVLCSGGDAPGMNPCIRAIVRAGVAYGDEVVGVLRGYKGLLDEKFWGDDENETDPAKKCRPIGVRGVSGLTSRGGSILNSSRCLRFMTPEGREKAVETLEKYGFDALVAIGGNGTLTGALELSKIWRGQVVGLPGTIDNDLLGTNYTIGFATATMTGVEAVDKLRDTAGSHDMMFLVEVMGRHCGDLAAYVALAGGCELVAVPEVKTDPAKMVEKLKRFQELGKKSIIMIVAEGDDLGGAMSTMNALKAAGSPYEMRTVTLGHVMRGGVPCPADRILATTLGYQAVEALHRGASGVMVGEMDGKSVLNPLGVVIAERTDEDKVRVGARNVTKLIDRIAGISDV